MTAPVRCAVIPVGGLGTRFLPATKVLAKEMLPVADRPLIQYAVEEAFAAGIERIVIVTGPGKAAIKDHFAPAPALETTLKEGGKTDLLALLEATNYPADLIVYTEQFEPRGLGHAVWCARDLVGDQPFAVLLPDDLVLGPMSCLEQMVADYDRVGGNLVSVMDLAREHTDRYGVLDPGKESGSLVEVLGLVEKPKPEDAPSTLSIIGRYILQPTIFDRLTHQGVGAGGEIQLTDAMTGLIGTEPFHGFRFAGRRFDCGTKLGFLEASIAYALAHDDMAGGARALIDKFATALARKDST